MTLRERIEEKRQKKIALRKRQLEIEEESAKYLYDNRRKEFIEDLTKNFGSDFIIDYVAPSEANRFNIEAVFTSATGRDYYLSPYEPSTNTYEISIWVENKRKYLGLINAGGVGAFENEVLEQEMKG